MKIPPSALWMPLGAAIVLLGFPAAHAADAKAPAQPALSTNSAATPAAQIPLSAFALPSNPKEGRNPFFPNSHIGAAAAKVVSKDAPVDLSLLVLNGITSPPKRTAMINGHTFEKGEEQEVKTTSGRLLVKCSDIRDDAAIVVINGQQRILKLRFGL